MHAFGLSHKRVWDDMGPPSDGLITVFVGTWNSASRTEWLDAHRYLNPTQRSDDVSVPSVRMLSPRFVSPPNTIRLRFEVEDDDGLHQAQLLVTRVLGSGVGDLQVVAYKRLTGTHSTVEFVTTALGAADTTVYLCVIDAHGNFSINNFPIDVASMIPPPPGCVNTGCPLAANLRTILDLAPGDPITSHAMLSLWTLWGGGMEDCRPYRD